MKKVIIIIMMISLFAYILGGNALADSFTLHSNISFGMSIDEVRSNEAKSGFNVSDSNSYQSKNTSSLKTTSAGTIAGVDESQIQYFFNKDEKLYSALYWIGNALNGLEPFYSNVDNALINKYGIPDNSLMPLVEAMGFEGFEYVKYNFHIPESRSPYSIYNAWKIDNDDGSSVIIIHFVCAETFNFHLLGYQFYSAEEIENGLVTLEKNTNQINDDI